MDEKSTSGELGLLSPIQNETEYKKALGKLIVAYKHKLEEEEREIYNNNLYLFNRDVIGWPDVTDPPHREVCDFVQDVSKYHKKLINLPRGHLKSSIITVGFTIQQLVKDPSIRILIVSGNYQLATNFIGQIQKILMRNKRLRELYGEFDKNADQWKRDAIAVYSPDADFITKEANLKAQGIDSGVTSTHFDIIILDDVVTRENVTTHEQINKVITFYRDIQDIWDRRRNNAQIIVIGTRWNDGDLYGWLMDKDNPEREQVGVLIKQAISNPKIIRDGTRYKLEGGEVLFPRKFSKESLQELLDSKGIREFTAQYLNSIVDDDTAVFKRAWFRRYEYDDIKGRELNRYIMVDPAISQEERADYTAMVVVGVDAWGKVFVLEVVRNRFSPTELIGELFRLDDEYKPRSIGIEMVAFQKSLQYFIADESKSRHHYLPIKELKAGNQKDSKASRIMGLEPYYARGDVFHPNHAKNIDILEDELIRFPYGKHDDVIDALAYFPQLITPPKVKDERKAHHYLY